MTTSRSLFDRVFNATPDLQYRIQTTDWGCILYAMLKVEKGILLHWDAYTVQHLPEERIARDCLAHGLLSPRPYSTGQATDPSTFHCVMALYFDYCQKSGFDPTKLLHRSTETAMQWTEQVWLELLDSARWQGVVFPKVWRTHSVLALLVSLGSQRMKGLAVELCRTIIERGAAGKGASS
jgi:hypothetical protein